eukprot:1856903-Prymnesium_polylepis.1
MASRPQDPGFGDAFHPAARAGGHAGASELRCSEGAWPSPSPSTWRAPRTHPHPLARFRRVARGPRTGPDTR